MSSNGEEPSEEPSTGPDRNQFIHSLNQSSFYLFIFPSFLSSFSLFKLFNISVLYTNINMFSMMNKFILINLINSFIYLISMHFVLYFLKRSNSMFYLKENELVFFWSELQKVAQLVMKTDFL